MLIGFLEARLMMSLSTKHGRGEQPSDDNKPGPWWRQLLWFVGLYLAGIIVVGGFIYSIRWLLGMHH